MNYKRCILAQPWFTDPGHPATSFRNFVFNTKSAGLSINAIVFTWVGDLDQYQQQIVLETNADVVKGPKWLKRVFGTLATGTVALTRFLNVNKNNEERNILFLDSNLYVLSLALYIWPLYKDKIQLLILREPKFYRRGLLGYCLKWPLICRLMHLQRIRMFVRTEDLAAKWNFEGTKRVGVLPCLDLIGQPLTSVVRGAADVRSFIIAGQIRIQKYVDILYKVYTLRPEIGELRIRGRVIDQKLSDLLKIPQNNISVVNKYLDASSLNIEISSANYQLMLYKDWEPAMESAMLFESVKGLCPIIAFSDGWLGRMCAEHNLGWIIEPGTIDYLAKQIYDIPLPSSSEYAKKCESISRFYKYNSSLQAFQEILNKIGWA